MIYRLMALIVLAIVAAGLYVATWSGESVATSGALVITGVITGFLFAWGALIWNAT